MSHVDAPKQELFEPAQHVNIAIQMEIKSKICAHPQNGRNVVLTRTKEK